MPPTHMIHRLGRFFFRYRGGSAFLLLPLLLAFHGFARLQPPLLERAFEYLCLSVALAGEAVRALTVGFISNATSGRGTVQPSAQSLNTTGLYSVVRNPLYLGSLVTLMGFVLLFQNPLLVVLAPGLWLAFYGPIILFEEAYLANRFGPGFDAYRRQVPRLLPHVWKWRRPELGWSWRMLLRREHDTVLGIVVFFAVAAQYRDYVLAGRFQPDLGRGLLLGLSLLGWAVLKTLKRRTRVLMER